jgi:UDP-N-acetylglucosamine 2-epimerase (non-hydrolysing)
LKSEKPNLQKWAVSADFYLPTRFCCRRWAKVVLTDSGGIQEETSFLNIPCLTLRNNTERPVTVELGTSELVGNEPEAIRNGWHRATNSPKKAGMGIPLWDGHSAQRLCECIRAEWV